MCTTEPSRRAAATVRRGVELAEIFHRFGSQYRRRHVLAGVQHSAMRAIEDCRTAALGGHLQTCDRCGAVRHVYHSCRNRHCPKCQTLAKERWLAARRAELLPIGYFHVVFTLPHRLNPLAQGNPRVIYNLLFHSAAETLLSFGRDPNHLGGTPGITAILHTWGQDLSQHIHLHCLVTGGALSHDGQHWLPAKANYLFSVRALAVVFRSKFLQQLHQAYERCELRLAGSIAYLRRPADFGRLLATLKTHDWVVDARPPFGSAETVLGYLARYTHRVAITNDRILSCDHGNVRFRYKDYAHRNRQKIMTLEAAEFIRRFLLHVLPDGFVRIRHFGLLANRHRQQRLNDCRRLLDAPPHDPAPMPHTAAELLLQLTGRNIEICPVCQQGQMQVTVVLPPLRASPSPTPRLTT